MIIKNIAETFHKITRINISMVHLPVHMTPQLQYNKIQYNITVLWVHANKQ